MRSFCNHLAAWTLQICKIRLTCWGPLSGPPPALCGVDRHGTTPLSGRAWGTSLTLGRRWMARAGIVPIASEGRLAGGGPVRSAVHKIKPSTCIVATWSVSGRLWFPQARHVLRMLFPRCQLPHTHKAATHEKQCSSLWRSPLASHAEHDRETGRTPLDGSSLSWRVKGPRAAR